MSQDDNESDTRAVPGSRRARLGHFGRLAGGLAGGVMAEGARRLAEGKRPRMDELLLTPANVTRVADRLSHLRGAAMKLGQMVSLDSGDVLPPELSQIMARLRENAHSMPPKQLEAVLAAEWGQGWRKDFKYFNPRPLAAASIGQVHRATTRDGRDLAIKVQYPGVRESIDADVDNVATLLRVSGLLPKALDIAPLLDEAKQQLREEADYEREADQLSAYAKLLEGEDDYIVPGLHRDLTTRNVLAMDFVPGRPIETLEDKPQEARDAMMERLISLVLRELFDFRLMQTDPNFANYRVSEDGEKLVLLDFGAARAVSPHVAENYGRLLEAGLAQDHDAIAEAAITAGFLSEHAAKAHSDKLDRIIAVIVAELSKPGPFDFGDRGFVKIVREEGMAIAQDRAAWHLPPADILFAQRKISGTALLAARLKAKVDVRSMVEAKLAAKG
ncbi:ABC1 kinase family protein [Aurantiacibacter poecillastricola]|uniref:ABC1 kinase family protein n=1 Tax=Aurantiacibacter poecillastricola TaxID=3064385 RepID=UPI00273DC6BA|nr:AarF/ABC1/UbiB kinase family protein [Aurantiacibacter sp. 219JJ12-13]MDP5262692.1 AarF/ABC1/UbiB kinase family protein [Aurantiacibacter sp. 219JJ12-13]